MHLECPRAQGGHRTEGEEQVVVDDREAVREARRDVLELHGVGTRRGPLQADDIRDSGKAFHHRERESGRRPERVVDDDADLRRRGGRLAHELLEVVLAVLEVERARHLDEVRAERLRRAGEADELERARGLGAHRNGDATAGFLDHDGRDMHALVEAHGREVAGGTPREQRRPVAMQAVVDEEAHVGAQCRVVDRPAFAVGEGGRHRDVTPFERLSALLRIHPLPARPATGCGECRRATLCSTPAGPDD